MPLIARSLLILLSVSAVFLELSSKSRFLPTNALTNQQEVVMKQIYSGAQWYRSRPESEKLWRGVLQKRNAPVGPNTRGGLEYVLVTKNSQIPVYAANIKQQLTPFVERQVLVYGKLVDLKNDGFGQELWIGSIQAIGSEKL
jgi:hypothetical protein